MQGLLLYTAIMDEGGMGILREPILAHQRQHVIVECRWCLHFSPTSCVYCRMFDIRKSKCTIVDSQLPYRWPSSRCLIDSRACSNK